MGKFPKVQVHITLKVFSNLLKISNNANKITFSQNSCLSLVKQKFSRHVINAPKKSRFFCSQFPAVHIEDMGLTQPPLKGYLVLSPRRE
jgi:hypothetical protein